MATTNQQINADVIWQMLSHIPARDRETWITIGMALKSDFGDSGYSLFDEWSKAADNYDSRAVSSVWRSFKGGAVSIGSLVHLAKEYGWRNNINPSQTHAPKFSKRPKPRPNTNAYGLRLWLAADCHDSTVAGHQYANDKGIDWAAGAGRGHASGSLIGKDVDCLIVPIRTIETDKVQGVQAINVKGVKQTFGSVSGGALVLGNTIDNSLSWYIAEGWATAVAMVFHHQNGNGVCAASFGKSNQQKVAELIDKTFKPKEVIILKEKD